jgi:hypothetical protein
MVAATRGGTAALLSGRLPEDLLREAVSRWIESAALVADLPGEMRQLQGGFVPHRQSLSIYE